MVGLTSRRVYLNATSAVLENTIHATENMSPLHVSKHAHSWDYVTSSLFLNQTSIFYFLTFSLIYEICGILEGTIPMFRVRGVHGNSFALIQR